ncbi:TetR/AcrR family transcriptional regulator [Rhodococcus spelaei]|uniref:TetR/AcrR family transcriptional regulator n=1 Tax=Rhodococcus spelaei TaxID=2546320 RepID=A0A541BRV0_9NOCA|nr:TetR/AcrR family transcriptional regulator [Rhodococcus spelaei]TQF75054.1 TetR/AcrR family transcriptional regulator [Rhodococcus spelaei]
MSLDPPADRRRRRTHTAVLDAADRLFTRDGYRSTSVDALANEADVALSSIYANFPGGKADVYAALACRTATEHADGMREALTGMTAGTNRLLAGFDAYVAFHRSRPLAFRILGLTDVDDRDSEVVALARTRIDATLIGIIRELVSAIGSTVPDPDELVLLAWATVNGVLSLEGRRTISRAGADSLIAMARADAVRRLEDFGDAGR